MKSNSDSHVETCIDWKKLRQPAFDLQLTVFGHLLLKITNLISDR